MRSGKKGKYAPEVVRMYEREQRTLEREKKHASAVFYRVTEMLVIVIGILGSNSIARFIAAKISYDTVAEVTDKFGLKAGRALGSFWSAIIAKPQIIAVIVAGVVVAVDVVVLGVRKAKNARIRRRRLDILQSQWISMNEERSMAEERKALAAERMALAEERARYYEQRREMENRETIGDRRFEREDGWRNKSSRNMEYEMNEEAQEQSAAEHTRRMHTL